MEDKNENPFFTYESFNSICTLSEKLGEFRYCVLKRKLKVTSTERIKANDYKIIKVLLVNFFPENRFFMLKNFTESYKFKRNNNS